MEEDEELFQYIQHATLKEPNFENKLDQFVGCKFLLTLAVVNASYIVHSSTMVYP